MSNFLPKTENGGVYCCTKCGSLQVSEYVILDSFCSECHASRDSQELVTCAGCSMPVVFDFDNDYLRCRSMHAFSGVQPVIGMFAREHPSGKVGRVVAFSENACTIEMLEDKKRRTFKYSEKEFAAVLYRSDSILHFFGKIV